jgi:hypothetical protein
MWIQTVGVWCSISALRFEIDNVSGRNGCGPVTELLGAGRINI